jgi:hypothetical protein
MQYISPLLISKSITYLDFSCVPGRSGKRTSYTEERINNTGEFVSAKMQINIEYTLSILNPSYYSKKKSGLQESIQIEMGVKLC